MTLLAPGARSLKDKRRVLRAIKDRTAHSFQVHVAEVAAQDAWQKIVLGFAVVSGDGGHAEATLDKVARFIAGAADAQVVADDRDVLRFGDELGGGSSWPNRLSAKFEVDPGEET
jgi:uncharacterized protein YlxP (DUF503 family)